MIAIAIATYVMKLYDRSSLPTTPALLANGRVALKALLVAERAIDGTSLPVSLIREPPKKLPKPTPNVVIARPVTFWFALSVTVRKL